MGLLEFVLVVMILLKVLGVITFSWALVLIPLYCMIALYSVLVVIWFIGFMSLRKKAKAFMEEE